MTSTSFNNNPTPAQEEFQSFLQKNTDSGDRLHPEDRDQSDQSEQDDEDEYRDTQIAEAMRAPLMPSADMQLPPASFDSGRATGVKGVIADARAYEQARRGKWRGKVSAARRSVMGVSPGDAHKATKAYSHSGSDYERDSDEEAFLQQWRETRRLELENEAKNSPRSRRTSPSPRLFGRFDNVDALGYLDAIEKVGRETVVVVFVYDHEVGLPTASLFILPSYMPANSICMTVSSIRNDRISLATPRLCQSLRPLRQGTLRGYRI